MVDEYVVTDQLRGAFASALSLVKTGVSKNSSHAAYLHGSFGAGKSHFLTVLHAILNNDPAARAKPGLQAVIADHDAWLRGRRFLMVPYHLVGATDITSALLGGYVSTVANLHPEAPTPAVYRAESLLADAKRQREFLSDDAKFASWLASSRQHQQVTGGTGSQYSAASDSHSAPGQAQGQGQAYTQAHAQAHAHAHAQSHAHATEDLDDLAPLAGSTAGAWTTSVLDDAFAAPPRDPRRTRLVQALLDGPLSAYAAGMRGAADAFVPLETGLSAISHHAKGLGYDGIVLFLDELILWLQAHLADKVFVNTQVSELVKLIESGDADRPVPIVSFISRQRDLSMLIGEDIVGADVKNLEQQVNYLAERFDVINLEDRNLPAIIKERVLKRRPGADASLDAAFEAVESANAADRDTLLDAHGATHADWADFRSVYPLSPALLNVLVALSGALQRERTGLKLVHELLRRNADTEIGKPIPLGALWDVLTERTGAAFTDRLKAEAENAARLYGRVRANLIERYQSDADPRFGQDDLLVKTLLLSALAPDVPALSRLTGPKLAALNYGALRSRVATAGATAVERLRELTAGFGEIRSDGEQANPVFSVHVSDLDVEPLLDRVDDSDTLGSRRVWVKRVVWTALGISGDATTTDERTIVWQGTKRTVEFVFANVRDSESIANGQFEPAVEANIKFVIDYPFDSYNASPNDDVGRVEQLRREGFKAPTLVWLPDFLSTNRTNQLGRLLRIEALLKNDRLTEVAAHLSSEDRMRIKQQLTANAENLTSQLTAVLQQAYGINRGDEANLGATLSDGEHVLSLWPDYRPALRSSLGFEAAMLHLADGLYAKRYPKHLNVDPAGKGELVTLRDYKSVQALIAQAMEDGSGRTIVESARIALAKKIVHGLELGEVHDGPLTVSTEWRRRIDQQAAKAGLDPSADLKIEDIRRWIEELGYTGLDPMARNLIIAAYALISDKTWLFRQTPVAEAPQLERIELGYALRTQALPDEQEFAAALSKAAILFGTRVAPTRNNRNTTLLARDVREKAKRAEAEVNTLRDSLRASSHFKALGLTADAPRLVAVDAAADLIAKIVRHDADTPLVRQLAALDYPISDQVLSKTISSAAEVREALDRTQWAIVESVHEMARRADDLGEQAHSLARRLTDAANSDEFTRSLVGALREVGTRGVTLLAESQRRAAVAIEQAKKTLETAAPPVASPVVEPPPTPGPTAADEVSITQHGQPGLSRTDTPSPRRGSRRVRAGQPSALENEIGALLAEVRAFADRNPGTDIVLSWRVEGDPAAGDESGV
ncbi:MAG TPA: hypothetical protein VN779_18670 [Actinocrinis sp.]|nr:hypothetical protein [Actinocrinis sp.]HXR72815.1 hypothetical protein [Actinocrinis sp.]